MRNDLQCDGSCKGHAERVTLTAAAQLQATVNFITRIKTGGPGKYSSVLMPRAIMGRNNYLVVLQPENLHTYFELSAQAWTLCKAP